MFGHSIAIAVKDGLAYKAWIAPDKKFYTLPPKGFQLTELNVAKIKQLLQIHFTDTRRSKKFVTEFFKGHTVIEIVAPSADSEDPPEGTVKIVLEDLDGKTQTELLFIAFENDLKEYVKSSMTVDQLKETISEHLFPPEPPAEDEDSEDEDEDSKK